MVYNPNQVRVSPFHGWIQLFYFGSQSVAHQIRSDLYKMRQNHPSFHNRDWTPLRQPNQLFTVVSGWIFTRFAQQFTQAADLGQSIKQFTNEDPNHGLN